MHISLLFCFQFSFNVFFTFFFFFNDPATTEIYTLSLHDALPISELLEALRYAAGGARVHFVDAVLNRPDRKSTRLNSSHVSISYAVFCLKKKNNNKRTSNQILRQNKSAKFSQRILCYISTTK